MEIDRAKIFRSFANRIMNNAKECRDDDGKKEKMDALSVEKT